MGSPRDQTEGKAEHWLFELSMPGRVFRFTTASRNLLIIDRNGRSHLYHPGLERPTVARAAGRVSAARISLTSDDLDSWPLLAKRGHRFDMARGLLRHHYEEQTLEQSEIWLRGRVVSPSFATKDDPLTFRLERQLRLSGTLPTPQMRIDEHTFDPALIDPRIYGARGPVVVGTPGKIVGSIACPITPAYLARFDGINALTNRWVVAYHRTHASATGASITMADVGADFTNTLTVKEDRDLLQQWYSYVDSSAGWATTNVGNKHLVAWDQGGGGALNRAQTGALAGAGEILMWFLQTWAPGIKVDVGRMAAWQSALDGYVLGLGITTPGPVWDFIKANVLPLLAIDLIEGDKGIYFRPRVLIANPAKVRATWDSTPRTGNVIRPAGSRLEPSGDEIANEVTVSFGLGGVDRRYLRSIIFTAQGGGTADSNQFGSWRCQQSQNMFADPDEGEDDGIRPLAITTGIVYDEGTGTRIAREKATEQALPGQSLTLLVGTEWDHLDIGDTIAHVNEELHHDGELAVIRRKTPVQDALLMEVRFTTEAWGARRTSS